MVAATTIGFVVLIAANIFIENSVERELFKIHGSYIPLIEVGPQLEAEFARVMRGLQDAVAAHDSEALEATRTLNQKLLDDLGKASEIIYPGEPASTSALQDAVISNYTIAHDVSLRLMKNETGIQIVDAMNEMKSKYVATNVLLRQAIVFDKDKLARAFSAVRGAQRTAEGLQIFLGGLCLFLMILLSIWIRRSVMHHLTSLSTGLLRFGRGDFDVPVPIVSDDELGEVAINANSMARQIQTLLSELKATNKELESFSYSVAHDLRAPLRASTGFSNALLEDYASVLPSAGQEMLHHITDASKKMGELVDGLLSLSRIARNNIEIENVNLSDMVSEVLSSLQQDEPERKVAVIVEKNLIARGDPKLLHIVITNLISNAWKFTRKKQDAHIEFGQCIDEGQNVFFVRDNGAGFDMNYSEKLFGTFQRLHSESEFEGTGIGLATVQRIIHRHRGRIWAKAEPEKGATFFFNFG